MPYFKDITGKKYGRLTAIKFIKRSKEITYWLFRCECGKTKILRYNNVISDHTLSCGCFNKEARKFNGYFSIKHGESRRGKLTLEYKTWSTIKTRCNNPKAIEYKNYGGRGIKLCKEWRYDYLQFLKDMGRKPDKSYSIERINNNKGYSKNNCNWIPKKEECRNKQNSVIYNGELASEASKRLKMSRWAIILRIRDGWSLKRAFNTPKIIDTTPFRRYGKKRFASV